MSHDDLANANWARRGRIFCPSGEFGWMNSHAQVPTVLVKPDRFRVYFATRPERGLSMTTFVDLDRADPFRILYLHDRPILELGRPGTFDEHGIMPSAVVEVGDEIRLYYSGWSQCVGVPYTNSTGLAISRDGGATFERFSEGPILARNWVDPFSATSPAVIEDSGEWHMFYCSGTDWLDVDGKKEHVYDIKHARSADGHTWLPEPEPAIPQSRPDEALTRPSVLRSEGLWHMWYCTRGSHDFRDGTEAYRIEYAYSSDLKSWTRRTTALPPSGEADDWDSTMTAYPDTISADGGLYMFYNGDGFGRAGFGLAELSCSSGMAASSP